MCNNAHEEQENQIFVSNKNQLNVVSPAAGLCGGKVKIFCLKGEEKMLNTQ